MHDYIILKFNKFRIFAIKQKCTWNHSLTIKEKCKDNESIEVFVLVVYGFILVFPWSVHQSVYLYLYKRNLAQFTQVLEYTCTVHDPRH
jgi:hypothetical protein